MHLFKILLNEFGDGFSIAEASKEAKASFNLEHSSFERTFRKTANPFSSRSSSNSPLKTESKGSEQKPSSMEYTLILTRLCRESRWRLRSDIRPTTRATSRSFFNNSSRGQFDHIEKG